MKERRDCRHRPGCQCHAAQAERRARLEVEHPQRVLDLANHYLDKINPASWSLRRE